MNPARFIARHLSLTPVPGLPEIVLYMARPDSGLSRLIQTHDGAAAPYWAYAWPGGMALARYLATDPETVRGLRVHELGTGSGLVALAAARAGAAAVTAVDRDPLAVAAARLNAAANGVSLHVWEADGTAAEPPTAEVILAGDVFYDAELAQSVLAYLERCRVSGSRVLIGDPFRAHLPQARLHVLAQFDTLDVGQGSATAVGVSGVFELLPPPRD